MKIHFWLENFLFLLANHKGRFHACMCRWHSWSCIAKCGMNPVVGLCRILSLSSPELKDPFLDHQLWWSTELQASQHCRSVLLHTTLFAIGMNSLCVHSPYWTMMLEGILTWLAGWRIFLFAGGILYTPSSAWYSVRQASWEEVWLGKHAV